MYVVLMKTFGNTLKKLRTSIKLTQKELADFLKLAERTSPTKKINLSASPFVMVQRIYPKKKQNTWSNN